jgi:hypothetical protein
MTAARLAAALALAAVAVVAATGFAAVRAEHECALVQTLDGSPTFVSDASISVPRV